MELQEVLEKATKRPWGILYSAEHSEAPWCIVGHLGDQPRTVCKLEQIGHEANGILIPHAVNVLEPLLEAAKLLVKEVDGLDWEHIEDLREEIRQAEEVSP